MDIEKLTRNFDTLRGGWSPLRIGRAVLDCRAVLMQKRPGTLPAIRDQMGGAAVRLREAEMACRALPVKAWTFAASTNIEAIEEMLSCLTTLSEWATQAHAMAADEVRARMKNKGGRPKDPRLRNFVQRLALVFIEATGRRPTCTKDPETGNLTSAFARFVVEALWQTWPKSRELLPGDSAIETAILDVVAAERDLEIFDPCSTFFADARQAETPSR